MTQSRTASQPQTLYLAELDTRSFHFTALGATEREAREAMRKTWEAHRVEYAGSALTNLMTWDEVKWDVNIYPIALGGGLRDGEPIRTRPTTRKR